MADEPSTAKVVAGGAAAAATGGTFSYLLFDKMNVAQLLSQGTVFGLTVFSFVAIIVLFAGYATLPNKSDSFLGRTVGWILIFFVVIAGCGASFQMVTQYSKHTVYVNTMTSTDLDFVNKRFGLQKDTALSVDLIDAHGNTNSLLFKKNVSVPVGDGDELTLTVNQLERLPLVLQAIKETSIAKAVCSGVCDLTANGGDDVDSGHHDH